MSLLYSNLASAQSCDVLPDISYLDHQEIVETTEFSSVSPSSELPVTKNDCNLFPFNLNSIQFPGFTIEEPDFDWNDLLNVSNVPIPLDDINPSLFPNESKNGSISSCTSHEESSASSACLSPHDVPSVRVPLESLIASPVTTTSMAKSSRRKNNYSQVFSNQLTSSSSSNSICKLPKCEIQKNDRKEYVVLSPEEYKLLKQMNLPIPKQLPLNAQEEQALRIVRRKIRNKISAQTSRIKRQRYVVDLERRFDICNEDNKKLRLYVRSLEKTRRELVSHLRKLRSYISKLTSKNQKRNHSILPFVVDTANKTESNSKISRASTSGGTSLLLVTFMFLVWTALLPLPQSNMFTDNYVKIPGSDDSIVNIFPGRSRTLMAISDTSVKTSDISLLEEWKSLNTVTDQEVMLTLQKNIQSESGLNSTSEALQPEVSLELVIQFPQMKMSNLSQLVATH